MTDTSRMNFRDAPTVSLEAPAPPLGHARQRRRLFPRGWQDAAYAAAASLFLLLDGLLLVLLHKIGGIG